MTIVSELKKLTKTMTGADATGNTIDEVLASLNENYHGGDEPSYEVVAEIQVGQMTVDAESGMYAWSDVGASVPTISDSVTYYLNDGDHPSNAGGPLDNGAFVCWNYDLVQQEPVDSSKPYTLVLWGNGAVSVMADTADLANTTVRILKTAHEPSGGGEFVITGDLTPTMDASGAVTAIAWSNISVSSVDEINDAIEAGKHVVLRGSFSPQTGVDLYFDFPMTGRTDISIGTMPDSFYFSGEIVLIGNEADSFTPDVVDVASMLGQDGSSIYVMSAVKRQNKDHYEFAFTVTQGQTAGTFVATPDEGVTYAAIMAALAETPNVYAVLDLGFNNQIIRALFSVDSTASGAESTSALALFYDGTKFQAARLMVSANGADIVIKDT